MDYIEKLNSGQSISKVFKSIRNTPYKHLFIVTSRNKDALLHYCETESSFLTEWYDRIDDFDNYIYTKVSLSGKYNYIYASGKLVSPYWSDEMQAIGQAIWPIHFNGEYNFIKEDGKLLLDKFVDSVWLDETGSNSFIIKEKLSYSYIPEHSYYRLDTAGHRTFLGRNTQYLNKPVVDLYSYKQNLTDRLILHRRLFSLSVEDANGKELVSGIGKIILYNDRPISDTERFSEGIYGSLFSVRKEEVANNEVTFLSYDFATLLCSAGYRLLCFPTESVLPDTFEDIQVLKTLYVKVRKNGVWNIIDKFGDYVSKDMWFDEIELFSNGNAVVKKDGRFNFLKGNGILLSQEWYDEVTPSMEAEKFIVRREGLYNLMDNNLRLANRKWQTSIEELPLKPSKRQSSTESPSKNWSMVQVYDPVWLVVNGTMLDCYVLSKEMNKVIILLPTRGEGKAVVRELVLSGYPDGDPVQTYSGRLYFNKPKTSDKG